MLAIFKKGNGNNDEEKMTNKRLYLENVRLFGNLLVIKEME